MAGLFNWGGRKESGAPAPAAAPSSPSDPDIKSKVLPRFLAALAPVSAPVLLNLGPVVGQNISFFGDQLACKIFVEDLFLDVDAHARGELPGGVLPALESRLKHPAGSMNGILCWDLFDFLDKKTGTAVAARLASLLKPGGVIYGFFGTTATEVTSHVRYVVESKDSLRLGTTKSPRMQRHVLVNRDINKMFEGLDVAESVLLKSNTRETLFRKP